MTGEDFKFIGGHYRDRVLSDLWPWLLERGYASTADKSQLDVFLTRLGERDAHLRPGIGLQRSWGQEETARLGKSGELAEELHAAITDVLSVLDEPLPPACAL